jgi:tRNA (guanosine-2'-O-)-methyltransferase
MYQVLDHRQPDLAIIMENVHDPHNISAVMRTCDAVGVQELFLIHTKMQRHEKFGKQSSASAAQWLTIHQFDNLEACFAAVRKRFGRIYATHLGAASVSLYDLNLTEPTALLLGNEHAGVSQEALLYCDGNFIIPQVGMVRSLNISVACAVVLYEAYRQRAAKGLYDQGQLSETQRNALMATWSTKADGQGM